MSNVDIKVFIEYGIKMPSIDTYTNTNTISIGEYSSVSFEFDTNEYIITWGEQGEGTGWTQYTSGNDTSAEDLYDHAQTLYTGG